MANSTLACNGEKDMKKAVRIFTLFAMPAILGLAAVPAAAQVKIHGATAVTAFVMKPHEAEIKAAAGTDISVLPSSTSHGLADLAEGKADIAMLAEPLESVAAGLNARKAGSVDLSVLDSKHIGNANIHFIVNPSNPVGTLSKEQLAGLFSGKITNWSQVGGPDAAVLLVGEPSSAPHKMIADALAVTYPDSMRKVQNANQNATIVAQAQGALSYISSVHSADDLAKVKIVKSEVTLPVKLYLAYRKGAPEAVNKVVAVAAALGAKK
jgi:phosphate transport system substrate-binding protein